METKLITKDCSYTAYIANDGTEFKIESECLLYEYKEGLAKIYAVAPRDSLRIEDDDIEFYSTRELAEKCMCTGKELRIEEIMINEMAPFRMGRKPTIKDK